MPETTGAGSTPIGTPSSTTVATMEHANAPVASRPQPVAGPAEAAPMEAAQPDPAEEAAEGVAGGAAVMPPDADPVMAIPEADSEPEGEPMAMDECGLDTGFDGDEYCILPPPPDKGFQLHIGPSDYDNPDPRYLLRAGQELTNSFQAVSGNDTDRHFYFRQFRQRPSAHHNIITASGGGGSIGGGRDIGGGGLGALGGAGGFGHRIGTSNRLAEDNPKGRIIPPENEGVGIPIAARSNISVSLHSFNSTETTQLREMWINFWYVDEVTDEAQQLFALGDPTFSIPPGTDTILGPYTCDVANDGRMLWFYGHRHASNMRFSAWRVRGGQRDLFYEGFDWEEPMVLEYSSTVENPVPDTANRIEGGWSGILDLQRGDQIEWECHVINEQPGTLRFSNNTYSGEMCIMDGEMVGTNCR